MKAMIMAFALAAVLVSASAYAVPPTYEGQFGNPEEPALRIVKWPWLGFRKLVVRTHEGLQSGMDKESLCATACDGTAGAWKGSKTLVDHSARGLVYAPLPEKAPLREKTTYEGQAMLYIEKVTAPDCEEAVEAPPCCSEDARGEKYLELDTGESDVEKAQRRYVPLRAATRDRVRAGGGNLLKLAR